jgi:hypothetical protein
MGSEEELQLAMAAQDFKKHRRLSKAHLTVCLDAESCKPL